MTYDPEQIKAWGEADSPRSLHDIDRYNLAALAQGFAVEALLDLIADLTDQSACRYDHHGHCQTHMTTGFQECPHEVARRLLTVRAVHEGGVS